MSDLGKRIKKAADSVGGLDVLAKAAGIKRTTIFDYASGRTEPKVSTLVGIALATNTSIEWLATGEGENQIGDGIQVSSIITDHTKALDHENRPIINQDLFKAVGKRVLKTYSDAGVKLPATALMDEQSAAYNALIERAEDPADQAELQSLLPWLENQLKKKLKSATSEPGTGKHEA